MKKNVLKLALDIIMGIVFALLFNVQILGGLPLHEIAGLAIGGAVLFHLLLNAKWIRKVTTGIFNPKTKAKTRFEYILDTLLLIDLATIIISGIFFRGTLYQPCRFIRHAIDAQHTHSHILYRLGANRCPYRFASLMAYQHVS